MRPSGAQLNNALPGRLYRYCDDSSTDGLDLSVDENGIMWEVVESFSEASESYRMSPYGSETAGDVDTSVLLSSRSAGNNRVLNGGQDTDEDVDSLDDEGILRPSGEGRGSNAKKIALEKSASHLPLGERITRILKCIGRDEDSESLDLLIKQNNDRPGRDSKLVARNATSVYGTERRVARPQTESPLERALAVQNRVKSLTFPRTGKKSVTISDTSSSDLVPKPPATRRNGKGFERSARQRKANPDPDPAPDPTPPQPRPARQELSLRLDPLDDFSSSSYASFPGTPMPTDGTKKWPGQATKDTGAPGNVMLQNVQGRTVGQKGAAASAAATAAAAASRNPQSTVTDDKEATAACGIPLRNGQPRREAASVASSSSVVVPSNKVGEVHQLLAKEEKEAKGGAQNLIATGGEKRNQNQSAGNRGSASGNSSKPEQAGSGDGERRNLSQSARNNGSASWISPEPVERPGSGGGDGRNLTFSARNRGSTPGNCSDVRQSQSQNVQNPGGEVTKSSGLAVEDRPISQLEASTVKRQPSPVNAPLTRQASVSTDESDLRKFAEAPLEPAKQLRARFSQSRSDSSYQSSEAEDVCVSPPLPLPPPLSLRDTGDNDSTDFDFESDLEKFTAPGGGGGAKKGVAAGKVGSRRGVHKRLKTRRMSGAKHSGPSASGAFDGKKSAAVVSFTLMSVHFAQFQPGPSAV